MALFKTLGSDINAMRADNNLGPYTSLDDIIDLPIPYFHLWSSHFLPKPHDWSEHLNVTGWCQLPAPNWDPPENLLKFLENGDPPIYFGFGSMPVTDSKKLIDALLSTMSFLNRRAIICAGWSRVEGEHMENLPENVLLINYAPHGWLFPRCAAAVIHGGAGTVGACLEAGCPPIIYPVMGDQPFWGHMVRRAGLGLKPVHYQKMKAKNLKQKISFAISEAVQIRAKELSERIKEEDGVSAQVEGVIQIWEEGKGYIPVPKREPPRRKSSISTPRKRSEAPPLLQENDT